MKGGHFLTLNTVIRVNQIEAARNLKEGEDEAAVHAPETVAAFRDAVSKDFPGGTRERIIYWLRAAVLISASGHQGRSKLSLEQRVETINV